MAGGIRTAVGQPAGLAGWLLEWFRMPLGQRFARLVTRLGQDRTGPRMELVEALSLGGKQQLLLVVCDGQRYLVGTGGESVQSIVPMGQQLVQSAGANAETGKSVGGTRAHGIRMVVRPGAEDVGCGW